jgi:pyrroloquinoline-quinone synthase
MNTATHLDQSTQRWSLLESRFYQAWNEGTLPVGALRSYASQYGAFIALIPDGWDRAGESAIADLERSHVQMWRRFAASLGTDIGSPRTAEVAELVSGTGRLLGSRSQTLGALYAFEAQQPETARTKLAGLRHYSLGSEASEYFAVHAADDQEAGILLRHINELPEPEQQVAADACERTCKALRVALDGLYNEECVAAPVVANG